MPYVQRDEGGTITGTFANEQPGYAEEYLPDDDPEVVAFLEPLPPTPTTEQSLLFEHENRLLALEGQPPLSVGDFINKVAAKAP